MAIDFDTVLDDLDGKPLIEFDAKGDQPQKNWTLRSAARMGLTRNAPVNFAPMTGDELFKRYNLAMKIVNTIQPELTPEEITLIKLCIEQNINNVLIYGAVCAYINTCINEKTAG